MEKTLRIVVTNPNYEILWANQLTIEIPFLDTKNANLLKVALGKN